MKILVACEESQAATTAFRLLGHEAYSCDIVPTRGDHPEWHITDDATRALKPWYVWDMVIAFPPCTHLSVSGARYFAEKRADGRQQEAIDFFMFFTQLDWIPKVAIENPVGIMSGMYRKPDQIIHPYMFGHSASKQTCLWLKGLPLLTPTNVIEPSFYVNGRPRWDNQTPSGQNKLGPSPERARVRGRTYPGVAKAMAAQWG